MLNIEFSSALMQDCLKHFNELDNEKRLYYSHYDLAKNTPLNNPEAWKKFLTDPQVAQWIEGELNLIKELQYRRIIGTASDDKRSPGTAQMLNALSKTMEDTDKKEGPVFIYCATPLNTREQNAMNVRIIPKGE